jgi:cellulose synthase/poly-beta-1,6-N-acetylglucosamine synthase-like glycosyltransferase
MKKNPWHAEVPILHNLIKQRFRWMYGNLQTIWIHKDAIFNPRYKALGFYAIPNVLVFQIFFPLISPIIDLAVLLSVFWAAWQKYYHPASFSSVALREVILLSAFYTLDVFSTLLAFLLERKED